VPNIIGLVVFPGFYLPLAKTWEHGFNKVSTARCKFFLLVLQATNRKQHKNFIIGGAPDTNILAAV